MLPNIIGLKPLKLQCVRLSVDVQLFLCNSWSDTPACERQKFLKGIFFSLGLPREVGWWRCCRIPHGPQQWDETRPHAMCRAITYCIPITQEGVPGFFTKVQAFLILWNFPPASQTGFSGFWLVSMRLDGKASQQQGVLLLPFVFCPDSIPLTVCPVSMSVGFSLVLWVLLSSWKASSKEHDWQVANI